MVFAYSNCTLAEVRTLVVDFQPLQFDLFSRSLLCGVFVLYKEEKTLACSDR